MKSFYKAILSFVFIVLVGGSGCANLNSLVDIADVDPSTVKHPVKKELSGPEFRFFNAIRKDSVTVARTLISDGVNMNTILWNQQPPENPVLLAVQAGSKKMLRLLLRKGADPNGLPPVQTTALIRAIELEKHELIQMLIESGADVNQSTHSTHQTALHTAVHKKDLKTAKILLRKGANVNAQDQVGKTSLMDSVEMECVECVKLLIQNNASKVLKDSHGKKAIDYAPVKSKKEIQSWLG